MSFRHPFHFPQWLVHLSAIIPILWLVFSLLLHGGGANPVQYLEKRTGDYALILLLASLACTPLNLFTGLSLFTRFRRPLGVYAAIYAAVHLLLFIGLDFVFAWPEIFNQLLQETYLWFGLAALIILLALAFTSTQRSQKRLKKNWQRLHNLVYLAGGLVVLHFALSIKGNFFMLRGAVFWPLIAIAVLLILLGIRIMPVQRAIKHLRQSLHQHIVR